MNARTEREYEEKQVTGTTIATDVIALDIDTRRRDNICLLIKNTGATNGLTYTINSKAKYGGDLSKEEVAATNLAAAATAQVIVTAKYFSEYIIYVKDQSAPNHTTYEIEAIIKG